MVGILDLYEGGSMSERSGVFFEMSFIDRYFAQLLKEAFCRLKNDRGVT